MTNHMDLGRALTAHRSLLDTAEGMPGAIDLSKERVGHWVPLVLFARLVHLGEAVHRLVEQGFTDVADPLTRAMVSAAMNIVAIVDKDSDGRALAFLAIVPRIRKKRLEALVRHELLSRGDADQIESEHAANDQMVLAEYGRKGVRAAKIGGGKGWHGLTFDECLFKTMDAGFWYDLYYSPFSDDVHVNAAAIGPEIAALRNGNQLEFGPRMSNPGITLMASNQAICQALRQLDSQRGWGRQEQIDELFHRTRQEIEAALGIEGC